ncbi:MAG: GntR family transcriptional regulator, partial [Pseudomonadota bacterium]
MARIERRPLHDEVLQRLRDMIVEGRWLAGEIIPELAICEELGVSRTPLREALKVLAFEGLVVLLPSRGAIVTQPTPKEAHDMVVLMGGLESFAGRLACAVATDAQLQRIERLHGTMLKAYEKRERRAYFKANRQIHEQIVTASDNQALINTHTSLRLRLRRLLYIAHDQSSAWDEAVVEHQASLDALLKRHPARL